LAVALEQYTIRTIQYADAVLQLIKTQYPGKSSGLEKILSSNEINKDIIKDVTVIDNTGQAVNLTKNHSSGAALNFSKSDYFAFHAKNSKDTLFISEPVSSVTIGKPVIIISRRLNDRQGRFAGVVALQIEPVTFTSFYAQANLSKNDIISLISPRGITYARRTGSVESYGENIIKSPLFTHVRNNEDSFYFARDAIKSIPTWFSYRKLKDYPIIATVGSSEADILQHFYERRTRYLVPRIVASILSVLFSILISMVLIHRKKMAERLLQEEKRYQRLLTQQVIAAQEKERAYIGRELHDNVNQVLTTVKLYLETALHKEEERDHILSKSMKLINGSINEIRNLSHQLSAPTLGTGSLVDSINALIEMVVSSGNLVIEFEHSRFYRPISMSQKLALYRIVQEQLNNVIKHAAATKVWVSLKQTGTTTSLSVKDNGKGFNHPEKQNGIGLNNIITRVRAFDGNVKIESALQKGCTVKVVLPITFENEKEV
jgi:signal transduction histidine kinase